MVSKPWFEIELVHLTCLSNRLRELSEVAQVTISVIPAKIAIAMP